MNLPEDVFVTDRVPDITYVDISEGGKEKDFLEGFAQQNKIISISGPSKSGKTTLCEHVITTKTDYGLVTVTGDSIGSADSLWYEAVKQVIDDTEDAYEMSHTERIEALIQDRSVLMIDDFHYITSEARSIICQQIKNAASKGLRIVCLTVPHRGDDPVRDNADLAGRFFSLNFDYWKESDLVQIADLGFPKCDYPVPQPFRNHLAQEALRSPQIMQTLCLETCRTFNLDQGVTPESFNEAHLRKVKEQTLRSYDNRTNVQKLRQGPANGPKRKLHKTIYGNKLDIYQILIEVIRQDPPFLSLSLKEINARVSALLNGKAPDSVASALKKYNKLITTSRPLDWDESRLTVIDPHFYFYLRNHAHNS